MFEIKTLEQLKNAKKDKEKEIQNIENNYKIALCTGQSQLTKNILSLIKNKLEKLFNQKSTPEIKEKENEKKEKLNEFSNSSKNYNNEIEDILALLTSGIGQKKRVTKITKTNINQVENVESKFIAYLENGVQFEIKDNIHESLGKRYLDIFKKISNLEKKKKEYLEKFDKTIKEICKDYVEFDFVELLFELSNISKNEYFSIYNFNDNTYIDFYGNQQDFKEYKNILNKIQEYLKKIEELNKQK